MKSAVGFLFLLGIGLCGLPARAQQSATPADRPIMLDATGVMRWKATGQEVALFGVNYYTPCSINYRDLKRLGRSLEEAIDHDVLHFARLGLDAIRLHVFDREISDPDGNLLANEHLQLLDYLIVRAKARGIYTVLTPIAWWDTPNDKPGFSNRYTMPQMIADATARKAQQNYLAQFVRHVNPHTGLAYADDPAVIAFELINEPLYAPGTTDAQITQYINALADAIRGTGCRKPLFYNGWQNRLGAVRDARIDGCTFGWYPTGLVAGRSLRRDFLSRVDDYPSIRSEELRAKAKIVYEFDAADVPGSYLYPAMARAFRSGGAQIATQFQYDPLPLAPFNLGWQTHYLNLVCSPNKAVSFVIAGEVFRRLPRLATYGHHPDSDRFGPFRVSYREDLSEMVTEQEMLYSNTTRTTPLASETLRRVAGCGSSPVVRYDGTGACFLDKLSDGKWRLEVYPDAVWVNDPFGPDRIDRQVCRILWGTWPMEIRLTDLGRDYTAEPLNPGNDYRPQVHDGVLPIRPGVYLLKRRTAQAQSAQDTERVGHVGLREFVAPSADQGPPVVWHEPPSAQCGLFPERVVGRARFATRRPQAAHDPATAGKSIGIIHRPRGNRIDRTRRDPLGYQHAARDPMAEHTCALELLAVLQALGQQPIRSRRARSHSSRNPVRGQRVLRRVALPGPCRPAAHCGDRAHRGGVNAATRYAPRWCPAAARRLPESGRPRPRSRLWRALGAPGRLDSATRPGNRSESPRQLEGREPLC